MYDDSMLFIANEIDRFSIGSTTDGLTQNPDGSLTIYLQHTKPKMTRRATGSPHQPAASTSPCGTTRRWRPY